MAPGQKSFPCGCKTLFVKTSTVVRFRVTSGDGRSSSTWRVWTGSRRPTDDTYLAPTDIVRDLKLSLHKDGYCQLGPTPSFRGRLFEEDRDALSRWRVDARRIPRALVLLEFTRNQLQRTADPEAEVLELVLPRGVDALAIVVAVVPVGSLEICPGVMDASTAIATLPREDAQTEIALCAVPIPVHPMFLEPDSVVERARRDGWDVWHMDVDWEDSPFGWAVADLSGLRRWLAFRRRGDVPAPRIYEFSQQTESAGQRQEFSRALLGLDGAVRPWAELSVEVPSGVDACAVIVVRDDERALIFVNGHARCEHRHLYGAVKRVLRDFRNDGPDEGWGPLMEEGLQVGWRTLVLTPLAATRAPGAKIPSMYRRTVSKWERRRARSRRRRANAS